MTASFLISVSINFVLLILLIFIFLKNKYKNSHSKELNRLLTKRGGVIQFLERELILYKNKNFTILLFDIDNFKKINESFGYEIGDKVIEKVEERLNCILKEFLPYIAYFGGDEFCIFFKEKEQTLKKLSKIIDGFKEPIFVDNYELTISGSLGVSSYPDDGTTALELLKKSEAALYASKSSGKNIFSFYYKELDSKTLERTILENDLRKALERNELIVYYQPIIDLASKKIHGAEALVRWKHPQRGMISPAEFIPIAENSGLIVPIGTWIAKTALEQLRQWKDLLEVDQSGREFHLSINVSAQQFKMGDFAGWMAESIWSLGVNSHLVWLELTESLVMENPEKSILMLRVLKSMGVRVAVDDFGTGYSALSYLKHFPIDILKIDQSFIRDVVDDPEDAAIVTTVISMAKRLGLKTVAEGVETKAHLDFLEKEGCDYLQGYYFYKPMPHDQFTKILESNS
ncbi:MAG: putative bifunctional diguanylate cyclase/phosphodiesterase [Gammaproteobacteria bacterium]